MVLSTLHTTLQKQSRSVIKRSVHQNKKLSEVYLHQKDSCKDANKSKAVTLKPHC